VSSVPASPATMPTLGQGRRSIAEGFLRELCHSSGFDEF
jgi:hypothetical protein